jgi:hypothetical protein
VGWSPAGFLGDELPSDKFSNAACCSRRWRIRPGDILLAHLGIWSRKDPWAPAVLEPLITGLKAKGFCFRTLASTPTTGLGAGHTAQRRLCASRRTTVRTAGSAAMREEHGVGDIVPWFGQAQQGLFEGVVQPVLYFAGMASLLEDGFEATGWLLVGLLQTAVLVLVIARCSAGARWRR